MNEVRNIAQIQDDIFHFGESTEELRCLEYIYSRVGFLRTFCWLIQGIEMSCEGGCGCSGSLDWMRTLEQVAAMSLRRTIQHNETKSCMSGPPMTYTDFLYQRDIVKKRYTSILEPHGPVKVKVNQMMML